MKSERFQAVTAAVMMATLVVAVVIVLVAFGGFH